MSRLIFLFIFLVSQLISFGQKRQYNRALEEINEKKFSEAYQRIIQLEKSEGQNAEIFFIRYNYHRNINRGLSDLDSAYEALNNSFKAFSSLDIKEKEKLCKEFNICDNSKDLFHDDLDRFIYTEHVKSFSKDLVVRFQSKYPESKWYTTSIKLVDSLDYEAVKELVDLSLLKNYIKDHPGSFYIDQVQQKIYTVAFNQALKVGTSISLQKFISDYSNAPQIDSAQKVLEKIEWDQTLKIGKISAFETYIKKYPQSVYQPDAIKKIEELVWEDTKLQNTLSAYKSYFTQYPNAEFASEAIARYESRRDNVLPYFTKEKKYKLYDIDTKTFKTSDAYEKLIMIDNRKFIASKYNKFGLIDKNGSVILPITYNCISVVDTFLSVALGDIQAIYTLDGEKVTDFHYESIQVENNLIKASKKKVSDTAKIQYDIFNKYGEIIFSGKFDHLTILNDTLFNVRVNNAAYLLNHRSKISSSKYESISFAEKGLMTVQSAQKYGVINLLGAVVIPVIYETVFGYDSSAFFWVKNKAGQQALADNKGKFIINFQSKSISSLGEGMYFIGEENYLPENNLAEGMLFDAKSNRYLTSDKYSWVGAYINGYALAAKNNKSGYIDNTGKWIANPIYDEDLRYKFMDEGDHGEGGMDYYDDETTYVPEVLYCYNSFNSRSNTDDVLYNYNSRGFSFYNDLAIVSINNSFGYINKKGELKIPLIYSYVENFVNGLANVTIQEGEKHISQIIDTNGKTIVSNASILFFFDANRKALLKQDDNFFVLSLPGFQTSKLNVRPGYDYFTPMSDYFTASYKEVDVVVLASGFELMDKQIDFSEYDFKQSVLKINDLYYMGSTQEAINGYQQLLKQRPQSYTLHYMLAMCYLELKDDYNYKNYLGKAINIRPSNTELRQRRAEYNYEKSNWRDAIDDLNIIIPELQYFNEDLYFKRGYAYSKIGYENEAFSDYSAMISNNTSSSSAYNNRGVIYQNRSQYTNALSDYNNAIAKCEKSDTESLGLYYSNKGNVLLALERKVEACVAWKKALSYGRTSVQSMINRYCNSK